MDQMEFRLLERVHAPSVVPEQWVRFSKTYRHAVRTAWELRRIKAAKPADMARDMCFYAQHISDWLEADDKPSRRSLPAKDIHDFEVWVGNTLVSQWIAGRAQLTVLEELAATKALA